ncbi:MAG TPA: heparan-alpha-glucosaminide N-acetyltransferase domain-containing protein [Cyclobacteriaceae bacterium]|nr:heparan-alpha-glucosaminide N-acetyltransferase domain-containing protein [Cyclobacteriaceae bacterium]
MQTTPDLHQTRIQSIDFVRGLVMVLMAIDHVRVYSGLPAGGPEPGIFFTRWVTHFCAPAFVFLSGASAYLYGLKLSPKELTKYLVTRGFLLIVLELTVIRFFWTFNLDYAKFTLAGVIWMLGWCMILLGLVVRFNAKTVGIVGLVIVFFQNVFALVPKLLPESARPSFGRFWEFIYSSGLEGPSWINILYVIVPWIGVMAAGYGFGMILQLKEDRTKILLRIGLAATICFIVFGTAQIFAASSTDGPPFIFKLLSQRKYPASPLFLLMTLGPTILLMPFVEKSHNFIARALKMVGRVPFFYYLLHILLIHISALVVVAVREGSLITEWYGTAPYAWVPEEHRWSLGLLYLVFIIDVIVLYFSCRWYEGYKFTHRENKWLKFI